MSGGGPGNPPPRRGCEDIEITTILGSPNPPVIKTLRKGDRLNLDVEKTTVKIVTAKTDKGDFAGTITTQSQQLISCMEQGYTYVADVVDVKGGGHCQVEIHAS